MKRNELQVKIKFLEATKKALIDNANNGKKEISIYEYRKFKNIDKEIARLKGENS